MKKVLFMVFMIILAFTVVACNGISSSTTTTTGAETTVSSTTDTSSSTDLSTLDTEFPVIEGVSDVTIFLNSEFNALDGVTATDNIDGDITSKIEISGVVDTTKEGVYFLKYSVTDEAGNKSTADRYVTVEIDPSTIGDGMVKNGDFSLGTSIWVVSENEGGVGEFEVVEGVGTVDVIAAGWSVPFPRLDSAVMELENGMTYEVSFDAKADAARSIKVQVGQLLDDNPWFVDYLNGLIVIYDLSTDWETFTFKFTMNEDVDDGAILEGQLLFNHGTIEGEVGLDNLNTVVYYDNITIVESTPDPDTTAPTINGAKDLTLETGSVFDPLAGVSATDIVDGNIPLDATNYVSDVDTSVPGEYTVVYTVSDEAGNIKTITINVVVVDLVFNNTNEVIDGTFTSTTEIIAEVQDENNGYADITDPEIWYHYVATWDNAQATFAVTDGAAVIDVTAAGGNDWGVMLKQNGLTLVQGQTYRLSFSASSTVARDIIAKVSDHYSGSFALTTEKQSYSLIFTYEKANTTTERVLFLLGAMDGYVASTVTIDDVELSVLEQDELLVNGNFTNTGWSIWAQDWDDFPTVNADVIDGEFVITTDKLGSANWAIQFFQEGLVLEAGKTYRITFDAKADTVRDINVKLIDANSAENALTVSLTDTLATYTFEFTYNGTATSGKLDFELGLINESVAGTVTFDNVKFEEVESEAVVDDTNQVVNGGFDQVVGWISWVQDWEPLGGVDLSQVSGQLVVDVTALGGANWGVQLFQEGIELIPGEVYTVVFNAKASVVRDMNVVLIAGSSEFRKTFDLTDEMATYTYTFKYTGTETAGKIDFELGNISEASVPSLITFDSILFFRNYNPQPEPVVLTEETWAVYGSMTLTETDTEKTITYVSTTGNWWDNSVQGLILPFDKTQTHIVFTFTGVENHSYLFKIEVNKDLGREISVIATGAQQEVVLDLSTLSEADREQLSKIIIFSNIATQEGTLIYNGWDYYTPTE